MGQVLVYDPTGVYKGSLGLNHEYTYCAVNVSQGSGSIYLAGAGIVRRYPPTTGDPSTVSPNAELAASSCVPPLPAVDSTGAFYGNDFTDTQKWNASAFEAATPEPELHIPIAFPGAIATDPTNDDLYLVREGIRHYDSNGNALEAPFGVPGDTTRVAIDGNHRILSAEFGGGVVIYSPTTANLPTIAEEPAFSSNITPQTAEVTGKVDPDGAGNIIGCEFRLTYGEQTAPCTPAASPGTPITSPTVVTGKFTGLSASTSYQYRLYVTNANGTQLSTLYGFSTPVAVTNLTTDPATAVTKESADLNASYEGEGLETHYYFEWGLDSEYGNVAPGSPANAGSGSGIQHVAPIGISGLKGNTTYHYRVVASNEHGVTFGPDQTLVTAEPVSNLTAEPPSNLTNNSGELRGSYTADKYETHYFFEWGATSKYGKTLPVPPGAMPPGSGKASFPAAPISGLEEGVTYHFRIVAENENGKSVTPDTTFKTAEPPSVDNLDTHEVTTTSARLTGEINPHSSDTAYYFEWGPTTSYGNTVPVPVGDAGSGFVGFPVSAELEDLVVGTTYHFRLVATNEYGTTTSVDQTFSFYPSACPNAQVRQETRASALPDCRGYELVTPKFAQGAVIFPLNGPTTGLATNPAKLAYSASFGTFPAETGDPTNTIADLYISTRTATGWYQKYIGVPSNETAYMGGPPQDWVGNLLQGQPPSRNFLGTQVDPKMDRAINYNLGLPSGGLGQPIPDAMTNAPYVYDTGTGNLIERWPTSLAEKPQFLHFVGVPEASNDFSHFVFSSNEVWAEGGIHSDQKIVCCEPFFHPETVPKATIYDNDLKTRSVEVASIKGDDSTVFEGWVYDLSDDGSHILMGEKGYSYSDYYQRTGWTLPAPQMTGPLYLRVDGEHTYEIAPGKNIRYRGSTADGETLYLTSPDQLTPDDHDTSVDLYAWHESDESLTRISVGNHGEAGDTDDCSPANGWTEKCGIALPDMEQYGFIFANGTGGNGLTDSPIAEKSGDIYFESPEALVGAKGDPGSRNLYLYRDGTVRFVAALEAKSLCTSDIEAGGCSSGPVARMQVTPDGDHMALITNTHITGYDSGERGEMYTFDPETGRFACASCRRDGKPPVGKRLAARTGCSSPMTAACSSSPTTRWFRKTRTRPTTSTSSPKAKHGLSRRGSGERSRRSADSSAARPNPAL